MKGEEDSGTQDSETTSEHPECPRKSGKTHRRVILKAAAGGSTIALAGCLGLFELPDEDPEPENYVVDDPETDDDPDDEDADVTDPVGAFDVEFLRQEATIEIDGEVTLLDAGLDEGWDLPYQCEVGRCGVCKAQTDSDAREVQEMDGNEYLEEDEIDEGYILTCVSYPRDDFAVDTHPQRFRRRHSP